MNRNTPNEEELRKLYTLGYSMKEIAETLDYSVGKIHKYFHIYKIETRKMNDEKIRSKISNSLKKIKHKGHKLKEETKHKISVAKLKKGIGHKKKRSDGYIAIYFPDHPKSNKDGYIMEHDLVMECYIGRWLKKEEIVHHINHKRDDNRIENLKLMTFKEHAKLHMIERHKERKSDDISIE